MLPRTKPGTTRSRGITGRFKLALCCSVLLFYPACSRINVDCATGDPSCSPFAWLLSLSGRNLNPRPCAGIGLDLASFHSYVSSGLNLQGANVCALKEGGMVALGRTPTGTTLQGKAPLIAHSGATSDTMVVKWDSSGNLIWFTYLGTGVSDLEFEKLAETSDGGLVLLGGMSGPDNFVIGGVSPILPATSGDDSDIYLLRLRADGSVAWHTALSGSGSGDESDNGGVVVADDGTIYISGTAGQNALNTIGGVTATVPNPGDGSDIVFAKFSDAGTLLSFRYIGGGGSGLISYYGLSLVKTSDGNFVIGGDAYGPPANTIDGKTAILPYTAGDDRENMAVKVDPNGNLLWFTYLGGGGASNIYNHSAISSLSDGSVVLGAYTSTGVNTIGGIGALLPRSNSDALVFKLSPSGQLQWFTYVGGPGSYYNLYDVREAADGGILFGGTAQNGAATIGGVNERAPCGAVANCAFLGRLGTSGGVEWFTHAASGGGTSYYSLSAINATAEGGVIGIGYAQDAGATIQGKSPLNPFQVGDSYDLFLVKIDPQGNL
ncbi:MAG: hypothetical protein JNM27_12725 [Leptospirales bacterium]|nr:hypothetical protein [Leptospirales bacterium]